MPAGEELAPFRAALARVVTSCREVAGTFGVDLPELDVDLVVVPEGSERVRTDRTSVVEVAVSSIGQLAPPPEGANVVYGTCHEVGHVVVTATVAPWPLPPVVWDEALAHVLALDHFLPALRRFGSDLWPVPTADPVAREVEAARHEGGGAFGGGELLDRQSAELRELVAARDVPTLLAAVRSTAATRPRPEDWRWKLRGRVLR